ncbi:hypothetical protein COT72_00085 [archaeon CG10_big_fil_rev_8_21_14_0_10_43_11]|nr:MAG: hypothetical protein COT72_00085 [archaeon CG10_big_fil_rev_8_21_14_0_10_43_11]
MGMSQIHINPTWKKYEAKGSQEIPTGIEKAQHMEKLTLTWGDLVDITPLTKLKELRELDLSHNDIRELPDSILNWQSLRKLKLKDNKIETLNARILELKNLKELEISANPLNKESRPVLEQLKQKGVKVKTRSIPFF